MKTLLQTAVFWGLFLAVIPWGLIRLEHSAGVGALPLNIPTEMLGAGFAIASSLGLWSGLTMAIAGSGTPLPIDCPRRLVATGPYAHVRNPMAIAGLSQGAAIGLHWGSWLVLGYVLAGGIAWHFCVRPIEEAHLANSFGDAYDNYRKGVACWIPRSSKYTPDQGV